MHSAAGILALALTGCVGGGRGREPAPISAQPVAARPADGQAVTLDGALPAYQRYALQHHPALAAAWARARGAQAQIDASGVWPEPKISAGYFLRSVETRVGPQRARIGVQQPLPWPGGLQAQRQGAEATAGAAEAAAEAAARGVYAEVAAAYWSLWRLTAQRGIVAAHLDVIRGLSELNRGRLITGAVGLPAQQQIDLAAARQLDALGGLDAEIDMAKARLRAAIGAPAGLALPVQSAPPTIIDARPALAGDRHPAVQAEGLRAQAYDAAAEARRDKAWPTVALGADWIITGARDVEGLEGDGQDAFMLGLTVSLPLWQRSYAAEVEAAEALAEGQRAQQRATLDAQQAQGEIARRALDDAARQIALYTDTLIPQAEATHQAVLGAYAAGEAQIAQALLVQRDLLDLRLALIQAQARYATAEARLRSLAAGEELDRG